MEAGAKGPIVLRLRGQNQEVDDAEAVPPVADGFEIVDNVEVPAASEEYVLNNTLMSTPLGHIYKTATMAPRQKLAQGDALADFKNRIGFDEFDDIQKVIRKRWLLVRIDQAQSLQYTCGKLEKFCDILGVGDTGSHRSVLMRKVNYVRPDFGDTNVVKIFVPKLNGRRNANDVMFELVQAWEAAQHDVVTNYAFHTPTTIDTNSILDEWAGRTEAEVLTDIVDARSAPKAKRNKRQHFLVTNAATLIQIRRAKMTPPVSSVVSSNDPGLLPLASFSTPPSAIVFRYRDVVDGSIKSFTLRQYIYDHQTGAMEHTRFAAVLMGPPRIGKTPLVKSVAANLAMVYQQGGQSDPFALIISTVEAMPRGTDPRVRSGVPVIADDLRPGVPRGGRPAHTVEDMKVIGDIPDGGDLSARYSDVHFAPMMPRIFTSNDSDPHNFHPAFPAGLFEMSNDAVLALDDHIKALLKRFAFCKIENSLIPAAISDEFVQANSAQTTAAASALFGGANAIP